MAQGINRDVLVKALRPFGTTIFSEMTALSEAHHAVNLSQGFPDFEGPEEIRQRAAEAILRGPNQYAPSMGIPIFRQAVAHKMKRFYGIHLDPDEEITVTAGATEGLCATLLAILEPDDEVILLEPTYDSYPPLIALARARARYISLKGPEFALPREALTKAFNRKTKAIIINNPQNPCGKVFSKEDLTFMAQLCKEHHAYAVGDEVYEHLVYDGRKHISLLNIPELREQSFVVSSTAKTFSMTGWKQGYVLAAPSLSRAVRMSHQFITFCGQSGLQEAMAFAMSLPDEYYATLLSEYARKRVWLCSALEGLGFRVLKPQGTYYCLVDISPLGFDDDFTFAKMLPEKAGVAVIPCSAFWFNRRSGRKWIRFCFCKKEKTLHEAIGRLRKGL